MSLVMPQYKEAQVRTTVPKNHMIWKSCEISSLKPRADERKAAGILSHSSKNGFDFRKVLISERSAAGCLVEGNCFGYVSLYLGV